jgi:Rod binding domain-containing protein
MQSDNIQIQKAITALPDDPKLRKATRGMETYFVGVLLKKMHESAAKGGLFEKKSESATYREMFDDAVAQQIGSRGSFGIADTLYRQMIQHNSGEAPTPAETTPTKENE